MSLSSSQRYNAGRIKHPSYLTLNVGGQEFTESFVHLFIDCELVSLAYLNETEEAKNHYFKFPNEDPEEWKRIRSLLLNRSERVTSRNIHIALKWSTILWSHRRREECDDFLLASLKAIMSPGTPGVTIEIVYGGYLGPSHFYWLPKTKSLCLDVVMAALVKKYMRLDYLVTAADMALRCDYCRQAWYPALEKYVGNYAGMDKQPYSDRAKQDRVLHWIKVHASRYFEKMKAAKNYMKASDQHIWYFPLRMRAEAQRENRGQKRARESQPSEATKKPATAGMTAMGTADTKKL